jgi:sucrose-6-phosphate hydrolase SacC (GH32 family)
LVFYTKKNLATLPGNPRSWRQKTTKDSITFNHLRKTILLPDASSISTLGM